MFLRYIYTLKHVKPIQIRYQIYYRLRKKWSTFIKIQYPLSIPQKGNPLSFSPWIDKPVSCQNNSFTFLNQTKDFSNSTINWNEKQFGLLWAYNLNYMDYLLQPNMGKADGIGLINTFIQQLPANEIGFEPYPISLRGINWVKFLSKNKIKKQAIDHSLYAQYKILVDNIEYHLLGNHLLENGFSLLFGAFYFNDNGFYKKAKHILENELEEQILNDGGHFELSPMYHQIILDRLLDCINLLQNNEKFEDQQQLLTIFKEKANKMLGWLQNMTFQNGEIPHFNDSTDDIAPSTTLLLKYAKRLNINPQPTAIELSDSGYRRYNGNNYECIVDVGPAGPDYIPGHAHADMLSFVLYVDGKPLIIDPGISTYEKNQQRQLERSTSSHNTVVVNGKNQSDVWGGFRVGKRAKVKLVEENSNYFYALHTGYKPFIHSRKFRFTDDGFVIMDEITNDENKVKETFAVLLFDKNVSVRQNKNELELNHKYKIHFSHANKVFIKQYKQPLGFNRYVQAPEAIIFFNSHLKTTFSFK